MTDTKHKVSDMLRSRFRPYPRRTPQWHEGYRTPVFAHPTSPVTDDLNNVSDRLCYRFRLTNADTPSGIGVKTTKYRIFVIHQTEANRTPQTAKTKKTILML